MEDLESLAFIFLIALRMFTSVCLLVSTCYCLKYFNAKIDKLLEERQLIYLISRELRKKDFVFHINVK